MEKRQNDMFMSMLANPHASFNNIVTVGLTAKNTSLQDKEVYKSNKYVQQQYSDSDGNFNTAKFNQDYDKALAYYNNLATADYNKSLKRLTIYHRDSIIGPPDQKLSGPLFSEAIIPNPYEQVFNLTKLGRIDDPTKSIDELAQTHKLLDNPTTAGQNLENAVWSDSPNDSFFSNFFDTLVLALWDEDGKHTDLLTGEKVEHKKGDLKTNQEGQFYYEKLDGRDVYGRRVLNKMNVITTDGSFWNKHFDFFDSDDLNLKSAGATFLKNAALVGTMFIPGIGSWVAGLSVATQMAGLLGTFGKMLAGSDSPTLSAIEGWSQSLNRQTARSLYAQEHTWCWENYINLIGDVMGLLKEQRFIFNKIPAAITGGADITTKAGYTKKLDLLKQLYKQNADIQFNKLGTSGTSIDKLIKAGRELTAEASLKAQANMDSFVKNYLKIGEILSKGYMTGITVADTYGQAKQAGASDMDAALLTLGYSAGEYALLNTGLGEWILPELRVGKYKTEAIAKALINPDNETVSLRKLFGQSLVNAPKEAKKSYVKRLFNIGKNIANAEYVNGAKGTLANTLKASLAAGVGEGVEEVSEEVLADFSKSCYDIVNWLKGGDTRLNAFGYDFSTGQWDSKDVIDRYGMSLLGGFAGGSLTNTFTNYKAINLLGNMTRTDAILQLVYMGRNGGFDKFLKQVDKMDNLGDANSSATNFEVKDGVVLFAPGTETNNQNLFAKKAIRELVNIINNILDANGANISDESFLKNQTNLLDDLRFNALYNSTTAGAYINEFNSLSSDVVKLESLILAIETAHLDTNKNGVIEDKENHPEKNKPSAEDKQKLTNLQKKLKETKTKLSDLVEGKRSYEFVADALFEMTTDLSGALTATIFPLYAEAAFGKKFSELTENEKALSFEEYKKWKVSEGRDKIMQMSQIFRTVLLQASETMKKQGKEYEAIPEEAKKINTLVSHLYDSIYGKNASEWLSNALKTHYITTSQLLNLLIQLFGTDTEKKQINDIFKQISELKEDDPDFKEKQKNLTDTLVKTYYEITSEKLPLYLESLIGTGFANQETKFLLTNLINRILEFNRSELERLEESFDFSSSEKIKKIDDSNKKLNDLKNKITNLKKTAFEKNLDLFSVSIGKDPINISNIIERVNLSLKDSSKNISNFNMDEALYRDLDNAINTMIMYEAAIKASRKDNVGVGNYFGYSTTLNLINQKLEEKRPELAEIDSKTADAFIADIETNLKKLLFLKQLYQINQSQKLSKQDRVATKKDLLIYKNLRSIVTVPDDDPLKSWDGFLELQTAINGLKLHDLLLKDRATTIDEKDKVAFEKEKIEAENAIYDFFLKNQGKLNDPEKLAEFLSVKRFNLYTKADNLLNENLDNIDGNTMVWWIASRAAIKSSDFYNQYKLIINPKSDNPLAPIPTLELAVLMVYSQIINRKVFNSFQKALRKSIVNDWKNRSEDDRNKILKYLDIDLALIDTKYDKYALNFLPVPRYDAVTLVEGIAGSGKTSSVFRQTIELLKTFNSDLLKHVAFVHGGSSDSAKKILSDLGFDDKNSNAYGRESFMKEISPDWKEYEIDNTTKFQKIPENNYTLSDENEIISALGIKNVKEIPSVIFIDEISKFNTYDIDLINRFANKYGISVIAAGDFDLISTTGSHKIKLEGTDLKWNSSLNRTLFIRTPKLGVSMRTDNSIKTRNQQNMQASLTNSDVKNVELEYYEDDSSIYGDFTISYETSSLNSADLNNSKNDETLLNHFIEKLNKLISTLKKGEKIGYIYDDETSPIFKLLSEKYFEFIDFKKGSTALGLESRYYIIEANPSNDVLDTEHKKPALEEFKKLVYTGITRALQGSIIITPSLPEMGFIVNSTKVSEKIDETLNKGIISLYANNRKHILDLVVPDGKRIAFIPVDTKTEIKTKPIDDAGKTKKGLDSAVDPTPPPTPKPTPKPIVVPPTTAPESKPSHDYAIIESSSIDIELFNKLIDLQDVRLDKAETDPNYDNTDDKTDLKYGQIVEINDGEKSIYGVVEDVKYLEGGNHEYKVTLTDGNQNNYTASQITGIINTTNVTQEKTVSHDYLVSKYGDNLNIENITIDCNGISLILPLVQIPFESTDDSGVKINGNSNIITYRQSDYNYNIVLIDISGLKVPFVAVNTSSDGNPVLWFPFFGINTDGKLIFSEEKLSIISKEAMSILNSISNALKDTIDLTDASNVAGPETFSKNVKQIDYINDAINVENASITEESIDDNIDNVSDDIAKNIDNLEREPEEAPPAMSRHEDSLAPIVLNDKLSEDEYKDQLDNSSETVVEQDTKALLDINNESTDHKAVLNLYSFNTFELGGTIDSDGNFVPNNPNPYLESKRIDSINGLIKIDNIKGESPKTVDLYIKTIRRLRSALFYISDKYELVKSVENILGMSGINIKFALKSSPNASSKNRENGIEFVENSNTPFNKGISEKTLYNGSTDVRSNDCHSKSIVAVVSLNGKNILELPLLALPSAFSIILSLNESKKVFGSYYEEYENLKSKGLTKPLIAKQMADVLKKEHPWLSDLFLLYGYTDRAIKFINDELWTIAGNLKNQGPQITDHVGFYLEEEGLKFDATTDEQQWISVDDYKDSFGTNVSSVFVSIDGNISTRTGTVKAVEPGHKFVLISFDPRISTDQEMVNLYAKQVNDKNVSPKVILTYILPPSTDIKGYIENLHNIFTGNKDAIKTIGNLYTSYYIVSELMNNSTFKTELERRNPGLVERIQNILTELDGKSKIEQKNILFRKENWGDIEGLQNKSLSITDLFDGVLMSFIYNRNTISSLNGSSTYTLNENNLKVVQDIYTYPIYYDVKIDHRTPKAGDLFFVPLGNSYSIDGKPFRIHGKIDSPAFVGEVGSLVYSFLNDLHLVGNTSHSTTKDTDAYMNGREYSAYTKPQDKYIRYIENKIKDIDKSKLQEIYQQSSSIQEANEAIVNYINRNHSGYAAFTINGLIKIANNNAFTNEVSLFNKSGEEITNVTNVDNNGIYRFDLKTNDKEYFAEFNSNTGELNLTENIKEEQVTDLINNSSFDFDSFKNKDLHIDKGNVYLQKLYDVKNIDEFNEKLKDEDFVYDVLDDIKANTKDDNNSEILKSLQNYLENYNNEDTKNTSACPLTIKIKV